MRDCVIVCGYPANEDGSISNILMSRVEKAIELYKKNQVQYLIVSGGAVHNQYSEAFVMKQYAIEQGVDEKSLLIENKAVSTYHNMLYSKEIMQQNNFQSCFVVTNSWHKIKAKYYANKFKLDFIIVNADKPKGMSYLKVLILTLHMPMNMLIMRLKGYK